MKLLRVTQKAKPAGQRSIPVEVKGGIVYGQLLSAGNTFAATATGYTTITARLMNGTTTVATGQDDLYAVQLNTTGIPQEGMTRRYQRCIEQLL